MLNVIAARLRQGHRTMRFPAAPAPSLSDRFRGRPVFESAACPPDCRACAQACPTGALSFDAPAAAGRPRLDLAKCLFCTDCAAACPRGAIAYSGDYRLSARKLEDLAVDPAAAEPLLAAALEKKLKRLFGRSLKLRQVSAGGCNACEADVNVLTTIGWDLGRFGIQIVASPRHADGLLVTGPVTRNMELALRKTYDAVAAPKIVIAVGACALSGGPYAGSPETLGGVAPLLPVDLFIPGCPPHPLTILDGLLRLIGWIESGRR
jgi:Ni,Fe-hydrogenase III small subunit/formate hydrogenlyase subunit 6/NADH:ubiquinone oxidoreductase subunit I